MSVVIFGILFNEYFSPSIFIQHYTMELNSKINLNNVFFFFWFYQSHSSSTIRSQFMLSIYVSHLFLHTEWKTSMTTHTRTNKHIISKEERETKKRIPRKIKKNWICWSILEFLFFQSNSIKRECLTYVN